MFDIFKGNEIKAAELENEASEDPAEKNKIKLVDDRKRKDLEIRQDMIKDSSVPLIDDWARRKSKSEDLDGKIDPYFGSPEQKAYSLERYRTTLQEQYNAIEATEPDPKKVVEKLLILSKINSLQAGALYQELDKHNSIKQKQEVESIYAQMFENFQTEQKEVNEAARRNNTPEISAYTKSRDLELQTWEIKSKMHQIEKKMYDMKVDWSLDKAALGDEVKRVKVEELYPTFDKLFSSLQAEQQVLKEKGTGEYAERKNAVRGRLIELEEEVFVSQEYKEYKASMPANEESFHPTAKIIDLEEERKKRVA